MYYAKVPECARVCESLVTFGRQTNEIHIR